MLQKISEQVNAINWFEIPVSDANRAQTFYETILGIKMQSQKVEVTGEEIIYFSRTPDTIMTLSSTNSSKLPQSSALQNMENKRLVFINASPSIQSVIDKIGTAGGRVIQQKTKIPAGYVSFFIDTEGNKIGLHAGA